jgi:GNAT superfamily N-acetyltransferase
VRIAITRERPDTADAMLLIGKLEAVLRPHYAPESRHGYSVEKLVRENVHFFVLRAEGEPAGCGGIQFYPAFGELKRMFVRQRWRGGGLGRALLEHLAAHARANGRHLLRLETGIHQHEAIRLYERWGFARIAAFPPYRPDPVSVFYEKRLVPGKQ